MENNTVEEGKTTAITSYILGVGVLIAMSMNSESKNSFASFHIRQALGLTITFIGIGLIITPFEQLMVTFPMWIGISVLWAFGIISAVKGETKPIPLLGVFFQKWFKSIT
ncbi:MAG TPA: hypothetical protein VLB74_04050 [Flavobacterium sp.]|uniref:DUF4870 domain-containing protein n=1 Tax=Flavobacterium sp. TaxID=239 RepID=UPI002B8EBA97|nr:hypothetical protein [Flavobacterium sp.]HSD13799.1 hypothetical protein [Flavobacterium sp.]